MGPGAVGVNGGNLTWIQAVLNAMTTAGTTYDIISFHPYNVVDGFFPFQMDNFFPAFLSMLATAGYGSKPLWDTEAFTGSAISDYGPSFPIRQAKSGIRAVLQQERYGCPKEHQALFYQSSRGFWSFPGWFLNEPNDGGSNLPNAVVYAYRVLTQQLRGTTFSSELSFSAAADYLKGYSFSKSGGGYVTALFTAGTASLPITMSNATSAVDMWGTAITLGTGTINLSDQPIYVSSTTALTVTDVGNGLMSAGTNLSTTATPSVIETWTAATNVLPPQYTGMSREHLSAITANTLNPQDGYTGCYNDVVGDGVNYGNWVMPATATLTWGSAQTIKRFGVFFSNPWQPQSAPIAFTVQAYIGGNWVTQYTYNNTTATSAPIANTGYGGTYETLAYNEEWVVPIVLSSPISTTAIRIVETAASYGDCPDYQSYTNPNFNQGSPPHMTLNGIRTYGN